MIEHTATLAQPGLHNATLAEVNFKAKPGTSTKKLRLIAAHLLLESFDIIGSWEDEKEMGKDDLSNNVRKCAGFIQL